MNDRLPMDAVAALSDPATTPETLMDLAADRSLWPAIAGHPSAYPDLLAYLDQFGGPEVRAAVAARRAADRAPAVTPRPAPPVPASTPPSVLPPVPVPPPSPALFAAPRPVGTVPPAPVPVAPPTLVTAAPPPGPRPPAGPRPTPPPPRPRGPRRGRLIAIVLGALVVVLAIVLVLLLTVFRPQQDKTTAATAFTAAAADYTAAQTTLGASIDQAAAMSIQVTPAQVADPGVLTSLASALDAARKQVGSVPPMASTPEAIAAQTATLKSGTTAVTTAAANLDQAIQAVTDSQVLQARTAAKSTLSDAIGEAQAVLRQLADLTDDSQRAPLNAAVASAQQALAGLETADPSTFTPTVDEQVAALKAAEDALKAVQKTRCANGVIVPSGIDPRVCQGMPADALVTQVTGPGPKEYQFSMPSGNVGCTADAYGADVMCEIISKDWEIPVALAPDCAPNDPVCGSPEVALKNGVVTSVRHSDVANWRVNLAAPNVTIPVLEYGTTADFGLVACLSDEHGVVCWDTRTHHGFRINQTSLTYW